MQRARLTAAVGFRGSKKALLPPVPSLRARPGYSTITERSPKSLVVGDGQSDASPTAGAMQGLMPSQNIQDAFLNTARKERLPVTIYLTSGVKLSGRVRGFDKYCVVFETNHQEQLIFKHAISTVVTSRPHHHPAGAARAEEPAEKDEAAHVPGLPAS